jgi:hypothetical protein
MSNPWFGELYRLLSKYERDHPYQDVLLPWMSNARQITISLEMSKGEACMGDN